jgi:hypothetical protein
MKKHVLLVCALMLFAGTAFSINYDFGFGATVGTKMRIDQTGAEAGFGLNARGVFNFAHKFGISAGISYYLPSKYGSQPEYKNSFLVTNADFLFYFIKVPKVKIYGLGGIAYTTRMHKRITNTATTKTTYTNLGLELGSGLKTGPVFVEAKYDTKIKQFVATIGIYLK